MLVLGIGNCSTETDAVHLGQPTWAVREISGASRTSRDSYVQWVNGQKVGLFKRKELRKCLQYTSVEGKGKQGEKIPRFLATALMR